MESGQLAIGKITLVEEGILPAPGKAEAHDFLLTKAIMTQAEVGTVLRRVEERTETCRHVVEYIAAHVYTHFVTTEQVIGTKAPAIGFYLAGCVHHQAVVLRILRSSRRELHSIATRNEVLVGAGIAVSINQQLALNKCL